VCPTELIAFSDRGDDFKALNAQVIAISVDSEHAHWAWSGMERKDGGIKGIKIPLVSDLTKEISRSYDVLWEEEGVALRGMFILDTKGIIRVKHINDFPLGRNVEEAIRLLEAIHHADKHGEVCPAGWKKGGRTIVPEPEASLKYFKSVNDEL
jgi:alkyl hydroperoxide reductase subunit AhpC